MPKSQIERLGRAECLELLKTVPVGRIGITVGALPVILPLNFSLIDGSIVFRTVPGTKLAAATSGAVVAFEVDAYDKDEGSGWSVLVQGVASEIGDGLEKADLAWRIGGPWGVAARADRIVLISAEKVSGSRFRFT